MPKTNAAKKSEFAPKDYVVYPTHGVGKILRIEKQEISGTKLELFVIEFEKDKMTLRVPLAKVQSVGMRRLSSPQKMKSALATLKGRARVKRAMWSRRAQEYEAKINSGDPVSIAEVVRDLHRNAGQPDQSYQRAPDLRGGARSPGARTGRRREDRRSVCGAAAGEDAEGGLSARPR